jgi:DNA invertase Pin-like site-specific DNA recombinase
MKVGYTRVSKQEQNEALQREGGKEAGCEKYFGDKMTGSKFERKGLEELLAFVRPGDTVIVWKLDRLGRSLKNLIETLNHLKDRGVDFISLTEKSTPQRLEASSSSISWEPWLSLNATLSVSARM